MRGRTWFGKLRSGWLYVYISAQISVNVTAINKEKPSI